MLNDIYSRFTIPVTIVDVYALCFEFPCVPDHKNTTHRPRIARPISWEYIELSSPSSAIQAKLDDWSFVICVTFPFFYFVLGEY